MISLNMIHMECWQLVHAAFSRSNARGQSSLFTFKRALHKPPKVTVDSRPKRAPTTGRLKREDFRYTKFDSAFSEWKVPLYVVTSQILIGASDWKDHSMLKQEAEKYRTQNLPNCTSCPGVYELGIATSLPSPGRDSRKLDSTSIVPVYFGQADNVRTRLQKYGRNGAHLQNGSPNKEFTRCSSVSSLQGPGLFSEVFSRGLPIVYRWAPMKSKKDAEKFEDQLLGIYDYAWNKRSNGDRRPDDICRKLESRAKKSLFSLVHTMLQYFHQKQLGNKIKTCDHPFRFNSGIGVDSNGIWSIIFTVRRLQPRRVQSGPSDGICRVAMGHGSIYTKPPVQGRKRCVEHKGMK